MGQGCSRTFLHVIPKICSKKSSRDHETPISNAVAAASTSDTVHPYDIGDSEGMGIPLASEKHGHEERQLRTIPSTMYQLVKTRREPRPITRSMPALPSQVAHFETPKSLPLSSKSSPSILTRIEDVNLAARTLLPPPLPIISIRSTTHSGSDLEELVIKEESKPPKVFRLGSRIGHGRFDTVYEASNPNTGEMVAVKKILLKDLQESEIMHLTNQVNLLANLSHPNIVKYEGFTRDRDTLNVVLEYAGNGTLSQVLDASEEDHEDLLANYVVEVLDGLDYLHSHDVIHGNLRASNILTIASGNSKLSDFGLPIPRVQGGPKSSVERFNWSSPEVVKNQGASSTSDIWSLGCTLVELLTGNPPYSDIKDNSSVISRIIRDDMPPIPQKASPLLIDFIQQCFHKDPLQRPGAKDMLQHMWLKEDRDHTGSGRVPSAEDSEADSAVSEDSSISEPSLDSSDGAASKWSD